jgi:hypothetical protein
MGMHLCKRGFMPGYTLWTEHGEHPVSEPTLQHAYSTVDGLDEMLADFGDAMHTENLEDEPTADAKAFYAMLLASKEPLHHLTSIARLTAVTRLMAIKSLAFRIHHLWCLHAFFFSNATTLDQGLFGCTPKCQIFQDSPSHRIFGRMHEALNIDKK